MMTRMLLVSASLLVGVYLVPLGMRSAFAQSAVSSGPENSAENQRDRNHQTLTPIDQSNKPEDLAILRTLRRALVKDNHLSTEAKNIKIITIDGAVTLRGPVKTEREKEEILAKAERIAGNGHVHDEPEVAGW
jgi:hyperosmotically inducible periplasmic protein